jgi:hypothetical protein
MWIIFKAVGLKSVDRGVMDAGLDTGLSFYP